MKIKEFAPEEVLELIELELLPDTEPNSSAEETHLLLLKSQLKHYVAVNPPQEVVYSHGTIANPA